MLNVSRAPDFNTLQMWDARWALLRRADWAVSPLAMLRVGPGVIFFALIGMVTATQPTEQVKTELHPLHLFMFLLSVSGGCMYVVFKLVERATPHPVVFQPTHDVHLDRLVERIANTVPLPAQKIDLIIPAKEKESLQVSHQRAGADPLAACRTEQQVVQAFLGDQPACAVNGLDIPDHRRWYLPQALPHPVHLSSPIERMIEMHPVSSSTEPGAMPAKEPAPHISDLVVYTGVICKDLSQLDGKILRLREALQTKTSPLNLTDPYGKNGLQEALQKEALKCAIKRRSILVKELIRIDVDIQQAVEREMRADDKTMTI